MERFEQSKKLMKPIQQNLGYMFKKLVVDVDKYIQKNHDANTDNMWFTLAKNVLAVAKVVNSIMRLSLDTGAIATFTTKGVDAACCLKKVKAVNTAFKEYADELKGDLRLVDTFDNVINADIVKNQIPVASSTEDGLPPIPDDASSITYAEYEAIVEDMDYDKQPMGWLYYLSLSFLRRGADGDVTEKFQALRTEMKTLMDFFRDENDLFKYTSVPKEIMTAIDNFEKNFKKAEKKRGSKLQWVEEASIRRNRITGSIIDQMVSWIQKQIQTTNDLKKENDYIKSSIRKLTDKLKSAGVLDSNYSAQERSANIKSGKKVDDGAASVRSNGSAQTVALAGRRLVSNDPEPGMLRLELGALTLLLIVASICIFLYGYFSTPKEEDIVPEMDIV